MLLDLAQREEADAHVLSGFPGGHEAVSLGHISSISLL
jgi:hypothetical protein